ncbi:MAG TPA: hypothetical protein VHZ03_14605 [Trebonia sp.]|jgi:hypothetical protein|nr:hypothetical protein [Trebonia sp.]
MTTTDIRGDVVRLILDVDHTTVHLGPELTQGNVAAALYRAHLAARHEDGRPLTEDEAVLAATVTGPELDYVKLLVDLHSDAASAAEADHRRIVELMKPYPRDLTITDLLGQLPADVQAEMEILVDRVSGGNGCLAHPQAQETVHYDSYRRALAELDG